MRQYTDKQLEEIFIIIHEHKREIVNYIYEKYGNLILDLNMENIKFTGGKIIYMDYKNDKLSFAADITDVIMPYISHIGKDNHVASEGLLTDEFRRKY